MALVGAVIGGVLALVVASVNGRLRSTLQHRLLCLWPPAGSGLSDLESDGRTLKFPTISGSGRTLLVLLAAWS